jgi:hypothetical protein
MQELRSKRDKTFPKDVAIQSSNWFPNGNRPVIAGIPRITLLKDWGHKTVVKPSRENASLKCQIQHPRKQRGYNVRFWGLPQEPARLRRTKELSHATQERAHCVGGEGQPKLPPPI